MTLKMISLILQMLQLRQYLKPHGFGVTLQFWNISPSSFCDIQLWSNKKQFSTYLHFLFPLIPLFFQLGLLLPLFTLHQASSGDLICPQAVGRAHSSEKYDQGDNMFIILCKRELSSYQSNPCGGTGNGIYFLATGIMIAPNKNTGKKLGPGPQGHKLKSMSILAPAYQCPL